MSMHSLTFFEHDEFGRIRSVMVDGNPWFVAKDIASALGYADTDDAIRKHCKSLKMLKPGDSPGLTESPRGIGVIPESDLYRLIMRSKLDSAERFQVWVCDEVLPTIRKTGQYSLGAETEGEILVRIANAYLANERRLAALAKAHEETSDRVEQAEDRVHRIEAKQEAFEEGYRYFSVIGWAVYKGYPSLTMHDAKALGKMSSKLSREQDIVIDRVRDPRFGMVNAYHETILEQAFSDYLN